MTIPAALILALGLLPADCTVVIHNPAGLALRVHRVSYDVTTTIRHLDEAGKHTLELPCGAYWIAGFSGSAMVARVALPLHRSALRPQRMVITVKPDPSPDPAPARSSSHRRRPRRRAGGRAPGPHRRRRRVLDEP